MPEPPRQFSGLFFVWLVLGLGMGLRFANLLGKPVWIDEAFSLFHVSGFSEEKVAPQLLEMPPVSVKELLQYQGLALKNSIWSTIDNIANNAPELPPLYFLLLRCWMTLFGNTVAAARSLSAIFSLWTFPAMYWLCWELFATPLIGWYAIALLAVSPFQMLMAQEIRPYSLWTVCFLVASAALLRSQRTQDKRAWQIYTIAMIAAMYTHLFSLLIWVVHTVYLIVTERRWTKTLRHYLRAGGVIVIAFLPWIYLGFIDPNSPHYKPFTKSYGSVITLLKGLMRGIALFFVDFNLNEQSPKPLFLMYVGLIVGAIGVVGYCFWYLCQRPLGKAKWFLGLMAFLPIALFLGSDLLTNANRTSITRYFIPCGIAMEIAIAYTIAAKRTCRFQSVDLSGRWQKRAGAILLAGLLSCGWFVASPHWWHKDRTQEDACIVQQTGQSETPLLVTDAYFIRAIALGLNQLPPNVRFQFLPFEAVSAPKLDFQAAPTFLYRPTPKFEQAMRDRYQLKPTCGKALWQVTGALPATQATTPRPPQAAQTPGASKPPRLRPKNPPNSAPTVTSPKSASPQVPPQTR
jgi:uncharacterized membrane protein